MNKTKKKTSQLLALFMAAILVFSSFGSVVAVAAISGQDLTGGGSDSDCGIAVVDGSSYKATGELTASDKSDSTQANTQTSTDTESATYSTSLLQSAEWTNKSDGEAKINIHYTADLDTDTTATRSLYIFTTCNKHGFTEQIAIENIIELLKYNDYVDVIMIGATNYSKGGDTGTEETEVGAVLMFTLKADDFVDIEDGTTYLSVNGDNVTSYTGDSSTATKASMIMGILETYTNAALISDNAKVHVLGCATDDSCSCSDTNYYTACTAGDTCTVDDHNDTHYYDGASSSYGPYIEVLFDSVSEDKYSTGDGYKFGDYEQYFQSAAALGLTFQPASHAGGLFSLYYIAKYIDIIEANYGSGSFSSIVENILNSFDAFTVANKNLSVQTSYTTKYLYEYVKKYVGLDLTAANMDLSDMESKCLEALSVIHEYNAANRYISLVPYSEDDETGDSLGFASGTKYSEASADDLNTAINTIFYCLALMCPTDDILDADASRSMIKAWIDNSTEEENVSEDLVEHNEHIYTYTDNLEKLGLFAGERSIENSVTITTTITSEFELVEADDGTYGITVANSGADNSSFSYEITSVNTATDSDGSTTVTIEFTDLSEDDADGSSSSDDWIIDISIPVRLKNNTEFRTVDSDNLTDYFKDTNGSGDAITTATVTRTVTITEKMTQTYTEKVTVASPQLYKAPPTLLIVKTSDVASAKVGDTVNYALTVTQTEADATATGVVVTDPIPDGLSYVNESVVVTVNGNTVGGTASYENGVLTVNLGDVAYDDEIEITYSVTVDEGTEEKTLINTATAEAGNADKVDDTCDLSIQEAKDDTEEEEPGSDNTDPDGSTPGDGGDGGPTDTSDDSSNDSEEVTEGEDDDSDDSVTSETDGNDDATTSEDDDATADETDDDDATTSDSLPQTGDSSGALLSFTAALALAALATAAASALALRRNSIRGKHVRRS